MRRKDDSTEITERMLDGIVAELDQGLQQIQGRIVESRLNHRPIARLIRQMRSAIHIYQEYRREPHDHGPS
jgi:hypothetical protein